MSSGKKQTIGFRYFFGIHMGIGRGPVDELVEIRVGDRTAWEGSASGGSIQIDAPDLFGGDDGEGGIVGTLEIMQGGPDQTPSTALVEMLGGLVPGFRGFASLFYDGQISAFNPYPKPWKMRVRRALAGWQGGNAWNPARAVIELEGGAIKAMNPAHIVYECLTNRSWGRGIPATGLDLTSFEAAAEQLHDEAFGLCLRWARQDTIENFLQGVLDHIGAAVYTDRLTGLVVLRLIRDDYDAEALPLFDFDTGLLGIDEDDAGAQGADTNEIIVVYRRPQDGTDGQVRVNNLASTHALARSTRTMQYPGLPTAELALRVAQRDLLAMSSMIKRFKVRLDRRAYAIQPADVFRLAAPSRGIENIVLRAGRVDAGSPTDGTIVVTALQDAFALPSTSYVEHQPSQWTPPNRVPAAIDVAELIELPYYLLARFMPSAELAGFPETAGALGVLATPPTPMSLGYMITTRVGESGDFLERNAGGFVPTAVTTEVIGLSASPITTQLAEMRGVSAVAVGDGAVIDEEALRVTAIDSQAGTVTLARGCADSVPAEHAAGARVWFLDDLGVDEAGEYEDTELVHAKLLTRTSTGHMDPSEAPIESVEMAQRQFRPYAPGRLLINSAAYPTSIPGTEILSIAWAHRDRVAQADQLIDTAEGNVGPESGVIYNLRIYGEADELMHEELGLDDTSFVFAAEAGDEPPSWTPGDIDTELWLDAADDSTLTVSDGAVSEWRDKSGNGRHFGQGTADRRPLRIEDGVFFDNLDGITTTMTGTHHMSLSGILLRGYPFTVFAVVDQVGHTGSNFGAVIISNTGNTNYAGTYVGLEEARTLHRNTTTRQSIADADFSAGRRNIVHSRWRSGERLVQVNDDDPVTESTGSSSELGTSGTTWIGIERSASTTWPTWSLRAAIREIIVLDGELDEDPELLANIMAYLNFKWMGGGLGLAGRYRVELSAVRDGLVSRQRHNLEVRRHGLGYNLGLFLGGGA